MARPAVLIERMRGRLPIRLKLALVSGGLTFVILLLFAVVVGAFTEQKLRGGFDDDLRATAADLQQQLRVRRDPQTGNPRFTGDPDLLRAAATGGATLRITDALGRPLGGDDIELGPPFEGVREVAGYRVTSRPLFAGSLDPSGGFELERDPIDGAVAFVQYARPSDTLEQNVGRVRFFLAGGVLGGTILAFLAGIAVARRAMRPIAGLTRAAREIAETRDPAQAALPAPAGNDEVADLANTLAHMLRELAGARTESEWALERQRAFVADASHELRTPLTSILANLELLEAELARVGGPRDQEVAAETAASALRSTKRMRRLVGDLLLLARADAGRRAEHAPLDLAAVVSDAASEAAPLAGGRPLTLDLPDRPLPVAGSRDDLHRLALNLIENAFVHTPEGTPVVASARRAGDRAVLEVADRGPGVPADLRERIFERFARRGGDAAGSGGSGLGLAIVRAVAEAHGASVEVAEAEGGGALFRVSLPAAPLLPADEGVQDPEAHTPTEPKEATSP